MVCLREDFDGIRTAGGWNDDESIELGRLTMNVMVTIGYEGSYAMAVSAAGRRLAFGPGFDRSGFSLTMEESLTDK